MYKNLFRCWRGRVGLIGVICLTLILAPCLCSQTAGTGALTGTVTDSTGAVIPNATVTLTSADTGQVRTTMTAADGTYKFTLLPPGNYRVRFIASGFNPVEVPSATVTVTETAVLDRSLQIGTQTQTVTVAAEVEAIQTTNSALGTVVGSQTATALPLSTRNYTNLLAMAAGANAAVNNASAQGKGGQEIYVNGGGAAQNTYLQDGVAVNDWLSLGGPVEGTGYATFGIPNPDAIAEFKIQTSTYDAGYGRNPGANVDVITKSGTNDFHGTAFEFLRNTALNANDWFRNALAGTPGDDGSKLVLRSNVYGGNFGGPIKKDKLFFFASYQENDQTSGLSAFGQSIFTSPPIPGVQAPDRGTCPVGFTNINQCDAAGQAFITNLALENSPDCPGNSPVKDHTVAGSAAGIQVICPGVAPSVGPLDPSGLYNINPVAIKLLQLTKPNGAYLVPGSGAPLTNGNAGYATTGASIPSVFKDHMAMGNLDYVINKTNTLAARFEYERDPNNAQFPAVNAFEPGNAVPGNPVNTTKADHMAVLRLTTTLSNNLVNEAHMSYQRYVTNSSAATPFTNQQVGATDITPGSDSLSYYTIGTPGQAGSVGFSFGQHPFFNEFWLANQFGWADQVSWTHGKHSIRTGFEADRIDSSVQAPYGDRGNVVFNSFPDFLIGRAGCGLGVFLPGCNGANLSNVGHTMFGAADGINPSIFRVSMFSGFVQDDIKVNSRLTVNAGLRWEYDGFPIDKYGGFSDFWPSLANNAAVGVPSSGMGFSPTTLTGLTVTGLMVPNNYNGPMPPGLVKSSRNTSTINAPPWDDFAPRLGFAWQPTSSGKFVVRGGAGFFYDMLTGQTTGVPFSGTNPLQGSPIGGPTLTLATPYVLPSLRFPGAPGDFGFLPLWADAFGDSSDLTNEGLIGENLTVPVTYEWNLNVQWEFLPSWMLEVGYVGSHGIHQATTTSGTGTDGTAGTVPINVAQLVGPSNPVTIGGIPVTDNTSGNTFSRVPFLGLDPGTSALLTNADYKYNSLQLTVRKRFSHGLQLQAAYTWARVFNSSPYGIDTYPYVVMKYGPTTFYRPQRLVVNYVWDLPLGHRSGFTGKLLEGWSLSGVTILQDGDPLTLTDIFAGSVFGVPGLSTAQYCPGMSRANVVTNDGSLSSRVGNGLNGGLGYFTGTSPNVFQSCIPAANLALGLNTAAPLASSLGVFSDDPTAFGFGNAGFGEVLGPGQYNWDLSLAKTTKVGGLREAAELEFRAEFFNAFNHPQFNNPDTNVNDGFFGQIITSAVSPRIIQFALKYSF